MKYFSRSRSEPKRICCIDGQMAGCTGWFILPVSPTDSHFPCPKNINANIYLRAYISRSEFSGTEKQTTNIVVLRVKDKSQDTHLVNSINLNFGSLRAFSVPNCGRQDQCVSNLYQTIYISH